MEGEKDRVTPGPSKWQHHWNHNRKKKHNQKKTAEEVEGSNDWRQEAGGWRRQQPDWRRPGQGGAAPAQQANGARHQRADSYKHARAQQHDNRHHGNQANKENKINNYGRQVQPPNFPHVSNSPHVNSNVKNRIKMQMATLQNIVNVDSMHALTNVINKKHSFDNLIQDGIADPNAVVLIVKLLAIVTQSPFEEQKRKFLLEICYSNFIRSFRMFLVDLPSTKHDKAYSLYWEDAEDFWANFIKFSDYIVTIAPTIAKDKCQTLIDATANFCLEHLQKINNFVLPQELDQKLKELQEILNHSEEGDAEVAKVRENIEAGIMMGDEQPPENFRELSIFPSAENLLEEDFVRPNIVDGEYTDVEHYLDVQFRLLREDYVGPLRDGLTQYIKNPRQRKYDNIRVHENTMIVAPYVSFDRVGFLLQLDCNKSRLASVRWAYSKRLIHGSLLLLTRDHCQSFIFAMVLDRNIDAICQGKLPITIVDDNSNINYISTIRYTLIETDVYFEPYLQILKALQDPRFPEQLAMSNYIVKVQSMKNMKNANFKITQVTDVRNIEMADRWKKYWDWARLIMESRKKNLSKKLQHQLLQASTLYEEARMMVDAQILKSKKVIGMTTTGAARLRPLLMELKIPILIVEEAAEIMEAHVITAITKSCEHLILIGDHQQLRPSAANIRLAREYNSEISLFERMIMNKVSSARLGVQHRMRPQLAALICPHVYPRLENHASVDSLPNVRGLTHNLFFLTHDFIEETDSNSSSRRNEQEADLVLGTANYLMQQDYEPEDVTILAAYASQMFYMRNERRKYSRLAKVKITVVDNYQGEESKIILLSLVRNNIENKIGFLGIPNRICVALSRAREGFYIFGNIHILKNNSELWKNITKTLEDGGSLVTKLQLKCENHPDQITEVSRLSDFQSAPEGGCQKQCPHQMNCGHACQLICHGYDTAHTGIKCTMPCERIKCELNHKCPLLCWQPCRCVVKVDRALACGHSQLAPCYLPTIFIECDTMVQVKLRDCGHEINVKCYLKSEDLVCVNPCEFRVDACGHSCLKKCHVNKDPDHLEYRCHSACAKLKKGCMASEEVDRASHRCGKKCYEDCDLCCVEVKKKRSHCKHSDTVPCHEDVNLKPCKKKCSRMLACNHFCKKKCFEPCGGCTEKVRKTIPECKHEVWAACGQDVSPADCTEQCTRVMSCGHACTAPCRAPCRPAACRRPRPPLRALCGHQLALPCHVAPEECTGTAMLPYCEAPCDAMLRCGHPCAGSCGGCAQGRLHLPCAQRCERQLLCGHRCEEPCNQVCPPCKKPCEIRCAHNKCGGICGAPCVPCQEKCSNKCSHGKCSRACGAPCDWSCRAPCRRLLRCRHPCRGLCGDPCPPVCQICSPDTFPKDFLGDDFDDDARFVKLQDCGHILELDDMDNLMFGDSETIHMRACPWCRKPILNTYRYKSAINRMVFTEVNQIKEKVYGTKFVIAAKLKVASTAYENLTTKYSEILVIDLNDIGRFLKSFRSQFMFSKKDKLTILQLNTYLSIVNTIEIICDCYSNYKSIGTKKYKKCLLSVIELICNALKRSKQKISEQQQEDIQNELKRINAIVHLAKIVKNAALTESDTTEIAELKNNAEKAVLTWKRFEEQPSTAAMDLLKKKTNLELTMNARKMVVKAMGLKVGHWFKCPNGHIYCIADCGGATEVSKCNECGAQIGGTGHRLLETNSLAEEMDGARYAAWSEQNNMLNFQF